MNNFFNDAKDILHVALPLMGALLAQRTLQAIDTVMMGWLGANELASGALVMPAYALLLVICFGIASASGVLIARSFGADDKTQIQKITKNFLFILVSLSIPIVILASYIPSFFLLIGQDPIVVEYAQQLTFGIIWGLPPLLGFFLLREFLANVNKLRVVLYTVIFAIPVNFLLNYALMYGIGFIPPLGILGIGYATSIVEWIVFIILIIYILGQHDLKPLLPKKIFNKPDFSLMKQILVIGIPSGLTISIDIGFVTLVSILMGYISITTLAAHQILMQIYIYVFMIFVALGMASSLRVSYYLGANNKPRAIHIAKINLILGLLFATFLVIIFTVTPTTFINIFINSQQLYYDEMVNIALGLFTIGVFVIWSDAVQTVMIGVLRGFKDTFIPMLIAASCYWGLGASSAYYFTFYTELGSKGPWYGFVLSYAAAGLLLSARFYFTHVRKK